MLAQGTGASDAGDELVELTCPSPTARVIRMTSTPEQKRPAPRDLHPGWPHADVRNMSPDMVRFQTFCYRLRIAVYGDDKSRPVETIDEFSKRAGISHATLGRIVRVEVYPCIDTIDRLEHAVGSSLLPPFDTNRGRKS